MAPIVVVVMAFSQMKLGDLADVKMGYPFRSRLEHDPQGDVAVIQMKDIDDANLLHAEEAIRVTLPKGKTHHLLRAGDLLFRSRGRSNGAAQVLEGIGPAVLSAPMLLIRPHKVRAARILATSMKRFLPCAQKNESRGAKASMSMPALMPVRRYSRPSASVYASSRSAVAPASCM